MPSTCGTTAYLAKVFETLASKGFSYYKLDYPFAGAMAGLAAYRGALRCADPAQCRFGGRDAGRAGYRAALRTTGR